MDGFLTFNQVCVSSNLTASTQKDMKSQVLTPKFTYFPTNGVVTHEGKILVRLVYADESIVETILEAIKKTIGG